MTALYKAVTSPFVITTPTDRYLWHLFGINESFKLDTFLQGGLYLSRLDRFGDFLEGHLPRLNRVLLNKAPNVERRFILKEYRKAVRQSFAICFHRSEGDPSEYAWRQFGKDHSGIAIRTCPRRVSDCVKRFQQNDAMHFGNIEYLDHNTDAVTAKNILYCHFAVQMKYRQEEEARLLLRTYGTIGSWLSAELGPKGPLARGRQTKTSPRRHEFVGGYKRGLAVVIPADPKMLIDEVLIGRGVPQVDAKRLTMSLERAGLRYRFEK